LDKFTEEELEAELKALRQRKADERKARLEATPIKMLYTFAPSTKQPSFEEVYDNSIKFYRLEGIITNRKEAEEAGHNLEHAGQGGMTYLYNTVSGRIIMNIGGGQVHLGGARWAYGKEDTGAVQASMLRAIAELEEFIAVHPDGGDVTDIVVRHKRVRGLN